jgi:hypothetical protein
MVPAATMNPARWRLVGSGDPQGLAKARSEAINLVQWLARIANSYVTAGTPEQRTMLAFCAAEPALVTRPFDDDLALELRLASLEMQFREHGKPMPHILDPEEHSPAEVEAWLLVELLHRGVDHTKFSKALPYTIPGLMTGDSEDYSPRSCQQGLAQLAAWFQNAADVLDAAMRAAGMDHVRIACLPQTLSLVGLSGAGSKRTDFGFSPGTEQNPEPFFYADACAAGGSAGGKKQSILSASALLAESDPAATAMKFIKLAVG